MKNEYYFREDYPMVVTKEEIKEESTEVKEEQTYEENFIY